MATGEVHELINKAVAAVLNGAKRAEYQTDYWEVTAYRVITTIRVDIKQRRTDEA